jgi:hypothetical protein
MVIYLILSSLYSGVQRFKDQQVKISDEVKMNLTKGVYNDEKNVSVITEEVKYIENKLGQLKGQINFKPGVNYQLPADKKDWLITLQSKAKLLQKKMETMAADKGVRVSCPIELPSDIPPDAVSVYFEKLDVMEQILGYAVESRCDEVIAIGTEGVLRDFVSTSAGGVRSAQASAIPANIVPIKIIGNFNAINKFTYALISSSRFLCVEKVKLENIQPETDRLILTIAVKAVKIKDDSPIK